MKRVIEGFSSSRTGSDSDRAVLFHSEPIRSSLAFHNKNPVFAGIRRDFILEGSRLCDL